MSKSARGESFWLTGADCFLRAFDAETRRYSRASHLSQLVLRLGTGFDSSAFRRVFADVVAANPILRAPIRRAFGLGPPRYLTGLAPRVPAPAFEVHDVGSRGQDLFERRLNEIRSGRRGELLRVDAVGRPDGSGTDLAFTWLHLLFDGAGSELFVAFLEACRAGRRGPADVPEADRPGAAPDLALPAAQRERGAMATDWQARMNERGRLGARSLAGPLRRVPQDLVWERTLFSESESTRIRERASALAGFLTPMLFYMAAAIRAHQAVMRKRGVEPKSFVVPLPVNLRPRGREGAIFRSRVSLLWFQVDAGLVDDFDALLGALKEQRRNAIRDGLIAGGAAAMDYARWVPARLYARMARRALAGELCSFFFAYTGAFCEGLPEFFGARIEDGFHAPAVPPSPGSSLVFSLREGRVGATHVRQRELLAPDEVALLRAQLARDLGAAA
jgi:hypothetical protein